MTGAGHTRVTIACQGGGSHTASTAGVLARLFEDGLPDHEIAGLSGTSGGAICAVPAWSALRAGDPAGAPRARGAGARRDLGDPDQPEPARDRARGPTWRSPSATA
jgi:hypothetical protein